MMKTVWWMNVGIWLAICMSGCATPKPLLLRGAVIVNATSDTIRNIRVYHEPTERIGNVSALPAGGAFNLEFSHRPMLADRAIVSWLDRRGEAHKVSLALPQESLDAGETPFVLVYRIELSGDVSVELNR
jgi:hypothetical protein